MPYWRFWLAFLVLPSFVLAGDEQGKPTLMLDAGGHTAIVWKVLFTPDGKELITVSNDKTVRFWDVRTGEPLRVLHPPIGPGPEGQLYAAALSPDGSLLAIAGFGTPAYQWGGIYLVQIASGRMERVLAGHTSAVDCLAFSPDGRHLLSGSRDNTARVWDPATGKCEQVLRGHTDLIWGVTFSPDSRRVATASLDKTARIWSVAGGASEAVLSGHQQAVRRIAWSPDGKTLATGSWDRSIRLWNADGTLRKTFDRLDNAIMSVSFTADSRRLLYTWGGGTGASQGAAILDLAGGKDLVRFTGHRGSVFDAALSPDGSLAASTGGQDAETFVWKTSDGKAVLGNPLRGKGRTAWSAAWSKDSRALAWGNTNANDPVKSSNPLEHSFRPGDLEFGPAPDATFQRAQGTRGPVSLRVTGPTTVALRRGQETIAELKLTEIYDSIKCFTLLAGDRAAVASVHGLFLFDTRTGKQLRKFQGYLGEVWAVAPSPDDRYLLSAPWDQTLRVWDPERDEPLLSLFFAGDDWIAWTPEGYYAASPGGEKLMGWHVNNGPDRMASFYPAAQFRKSLYRPDVIKRLLQAGSVSKALALADQERGKTSERSEVMGVLPPRPVITAPAKSGVQVNSPELPVRAVATSAGQHPVTALRLLLDGRPLPGQSGVIRIAEPILGEASGSWTVALTPGKHRLRVQADSAVSQGLSDEIEVNYVAETESDIELPSLYVLAIGVARYQDESLRLHYAARDAQTLAETFRDRSKPLFRTVKVKLLTDQQASRAEILKGLGWLRREMTQKDYGVVFFSGHGDKDSDGSLYFLPFDVDTKDLPTTGVPADQLKKLLVSLPGKVIALLDACHAGGVDAGKKAAASLTDDLVRDLVTDENGLVVMCSSTGREFSLENNEFRMSNFTLALVEGLSGKAPESTDGAVYLHHLDSYVTDRVKELTHGRQHPVTAKPASIRSFPMAKP